MKFDSIEHAAIYFVVYELIISLDVVKIDFFDKEIQISNPNFLVTFIRKIFRRPSEISFHKIQHQIVLSYLVS